MEDHLKNRDRLEQEWASLCNYQADVRDTTVAEKVMSLLKDCLFPQELDSKDFLISLFSFHPTCSQLLSLFIQINGILFAMFKCCRLSTRRRIDTLILFHMTILE